MVALALSSLMVFGGTALARPTSLPKTVQPAGTSVTVLGKKLLKQHATGAGAVGALLTVGGISTRATCTDLGSGVSKVQIQGKSTKSGTVVLAFNGQSTLNASYHDIWTLSNASPYGFNYSFDVLTGAAVKTHYDLDFTINELGGDCVTSIVALSE